MSLLVCYYCICTSVAVTVANHLCLVCYHFSCSTSLFQGHVACLKLYLNRAFREGPGVPIKVTFLARNCIYKQYNVSLPYCKRSKLPFAVVDPNLHIRRRGCLKKNYFPPFEPQCGLNGGAGQGVGPSPASATVLIA